MSLLFLLYFGSFLSLLHPTPPPFPTAPPPSSSQFFDLHEGHLCLVYPQHQRMFGRKYLLLNEFYPKKKTTQNKTNKQRKPRSLSITIACDVSGPVGNERLPDLPFRGVTRPILPLRRFAEGPLPVCGRSSHGSGGVQFLLRPGRESQLRALAEGLKVDWSGLCWRKDIAMDDCVFGVC